MITIFHVMKVCLTKTALIKISLQKILKIINFVEKFKHQKKVKPLFYHQRNKRKHNLIFTIHNKLKL